MTAHFHAMNGEHGCMPDSNDLCTSYADAVETLVQRFELGRKRAASLKRDGYLELRGAADGASYCEITKCDDSDCVCQHCGALLVSDMVRCNECGR